MNNINIEILKKLSKLFNLKYICEQTGLNKNTIYGKIINNRELKVNEANSINDFFVSQGVIIQNNCADGVHTKK